MNNKIKPTFYGAEIITALVYICAMSAVMMNVICRSRMFLCTVIMTAASFGVYMLFYALRKKKVISALALIGLVAASGAVSSALMSINAEDSYFDFIFSSSEFFNPLYAAGSIFLFSVIIGFTTCYFSVYLPRPGLLLFPAFIPLILAARTMGTVPAGLLIFLVIGYMAAAMGCAKPETPAAEGNNPSALKPVVYIDDKKSRFERLGAMAIICAAAAAILLILPRSGNTPFGRYLDTVLVSPQNTIFGTQQLSNFLNHSEVNRGANTPSKNILFYASTDSPCYLSRWSYDDYNGKDGWTLNENLDGYGYPNWESTSRLSSVDNLIVKLKEGVEEGKLEKYRDEIEKLDTVKPKTSTITISVADGSNTKVIIHPNHTTDAFVSNGDLITYRTEKDELFTKENFGKNGTYLLTYRVDSPNRQFINMLKTVDFTQLVNDAALEEVIDDNTRSALLSSMVEADNYRRITLEEIPEEIQALADKITAGLTSDYEKAVAIEKYFGEAGFVYSLDFVPEEATAEYFLFESRTGICTDFATACVLLARAAGLPARYTEGFVLQSSAIDEYGRYAVTAEYAHAYASVYIEGYGWLEVDGTKYVSEDAGESSPLLLTIIIASAAVLIILAIIFRKQIGEFIFRIIFALSGKNGRIRRLYLRTRKLVCPIRGLSPETSTAEEVRDIISNSLSLPKEAEGITSAANELLYGNGNPDADTKQLLAYYKAIRRRKRGMKK